MMNIFLPILTSVLLVGCSNKKKKENETNWSTIGRTIGNKPIQVWQNNVNEKLPGILLIGTVHGNETPGKYISDDLIAELEQNHSDDMKWLNKNFRIYVIPCLNLDNFPNRRHNTNGIDLNRDFVLTESKKQAETKALIEFVNSHPEICLSLTIHAGALVACYPLDQPTDRTVRVGNNCRCDIKQRSLIELHTVS